jgi:hypothetical protein
VAANDLIGAHGQRSHCGDGPAEASPAGEKGHESTGRAEQNQQRGVPECWQVRLTGDVEQVTQDVPDTTVGGKGGQEQVESQQDGSDRQ